MVLVSEDVLGVIVVVIETFRVVLVTIEEVVEDS